MRWFPLARKEARTIFTSKGPWLLAVLVVLWSYRPKYVGWEHIGQDVTAAYVQTSASVLLPLGVLLLSFRSIVGEKTTGSIKFLLGLPVTRTDVLIGKIVGRTAGIAVPISISFGIIAIIGYFQYGPFDPALFLGMVLLTLLYVAALVTVAVSISATVDRTVTAVGLVFGAFFLVAVVFWEPFAEMAIPYISDSPGGPQYLTASGPLFLLLRLSPSGAYHVATNWILGVGNSTATFSAVLVQLQPNSFANVYVVEAVFQAGQAPLYLHEAGGLLILLGWIVVPFLIARRQFGRGDLV